MHLRDSLIPRYSELVYYGFWFSPERLALQALVEESQRNVTGTVRLKLYKGNLITAGRKSALSLYRPEIATMESGESIYNQDDATGFIELQRPPPSREGDGREAGEAEMKQAVRARRLDTQCAAWLLATRIAHESTLG